MDAPDFTVAACGTPSLCRGESLHGRQGLLESYTPSYISDVPDKSLRHAPEMVPCTHAAAQIGLHQCCAPGRRREAIAIGSQAVAGPMAHILVENLTKTFRVAKRR